MRNIGLIIAASALVATSVFASLASDNSSNYSGGWTHGSNEGSGFGAWEIMVSGSAGTFIGNPADGEVNGLGTEAFGMYANGSDTFAEAKRSFGSALNVGDTFSMKWGINFDSGTNAYANKGFNLLAGETELININNGGSAAITIDGTPMFANYGQNAMTINFNYLDATTVRVTAGGRDGIENFSGDVTVAGAPSGFKFYASNLQVGNAHQPYFDDLSIVAVPEPTSLAFLGIGALAIGFFRRRMRK